MPVLPLAKTRATKLSAQDFWLYVVQAEQEFSARSGMTKDGQRCEGSQQRLHRSGAGAAEPSRSLSGRDGGRLPFLLRPKQLATGGATWLAKAG